MKTYEFGIDLADIRSDEIRPEEIRFGWVPVGEVVLQFALGSEGDTFFSLPKIGTVTEGVLTVKTPGGMTNAEAFRVVSRVRRSDHVRVELELLR